MISILLLFASSVLCAENVYDNMYITLNNISPCIRRFNGTHTVGCTSSKNGNIGVLHFIYSENDVDWLLRIADAGPYIACIPHKLFDRNITRRLADSDHVNGILVLQNKDRNPSEFSPEDTCPNRYSAMTGVCDKRWNKFGSNMLNERFDIPIVYLGENSYTTEIEKCFNKYNKPLENQSERTLCAAELSTHMFGAVDSETCIRRSSLGLNMDLIKFCDWMGDKNIYNSLIPLDEYSGRSYIFVTARMDTTSMFYNLFPGAVSNTLSLVTLILTASLLNDMVKNETIEKNVLFVLFNGEAYDYIGSSRFVYDMQKGEFPSKNHSIGFDNIDLFLELSQLQGESVTYFVDGSDSRRDQFLHRFAQNGIHYGINAYKQTGIPPTSIQSFLKVNSTLAGAVFTSYDDYFENPYYHSIYDDYKSINYTNSTGNAVANFVANFASTLATTLYYEVTGKGKNASVDVQMSNSLLECFLVSYDCKLFRDFGVTAMQEVSPNYYVSVAFNDNLITLLVKYTLIFLTGIKTNSTTMEECDAGTKDGRQYIWIANTSKCLESSVNSVDAISPASLMDGYDFTSTMYSTWTESVWQYTGARVFLKPSKRHELVTIGVGAGVALMAVGVVLWIRRNVSSLFLPDLFADF